MEGIAKRSTADICDCPGLDAVAGVELDLPPPERSGGEAPMVSMNTNCAIKLTEVEKVVLEDMLAGVDPNDQALRESVIQLFMQKAFDERHYQQQRDMSQQ